MNEKPIATPRNATVNDQGWIPPRREDPSHVASSAVEGAKDIAEGVKNSAVGVAQEVRKAAESQVSTGKDRAIEGLGSVAAAIRKTGEHLRAGDQNGFTPYLDKVAQQIDSTAGYLRERSISQVAGDLESFARREPALFIGGAFAAGLIGSRFLKSSKPSPSVQSSQGASPARAIPSDSHTARNPTNGGPKPYGGAPPKTSPIVAGDSSERSGAR